MKLSLSVAIDAINIEIVAACLFNEPRSLGTGILTRSTPSKAEEAAKRVAAAQLVLVEARQYYDELNAFSLSVFNLCVHRAQMSDPSRCRG